MSRVSILIPCRNAAATLHETLESAVAQQGICKEIIVVDDGSTDGSSEIAERFRESGVRLIEGERLNASAARNRAFAESTGDFIQYLDADDLLGADKILKQVNTLERFPGHVATARWGRFINSPSDVVFADDCQLRDWTPLEWLTFHCSSHQMMHPAAWLVPRSIIQSAGPWDERLTLNDDGEYFARVVAKSAGLKVVRDALTYYRSMPYSLGKRRGNAAFQSLLLSLKLTGETLLKLQDSSNSKQAIANMLQRFYFEVYPSAPKERAEARRMVEEFGGSAVLPDFGPKGKKLARLLGWRLTLLLTRRIRRKSWL